MEYYASHSGAVLMIMAVTSINALAYNMIHSLMIKKTSAVTTTVLGELKIVGLLVLSALLLGECRLPGGVWRTSLLRRAVEQSAWHLELQQQRALPGSGPLPRLATRPRCAALQAKARSSR